MTQTNLIASRYEVVAPLGSGGMATVHRALDHKTGDTVALKVMAEHLLEDPEAQRRFKAEHRVLAALDHPGVPKVHSLGLTPEGLPFFAMELVSGESLEHLGPLPAAEARALLGALMPILAHLHHRGLVHGDLKGENLMRTESGALKLMDFGLAGPAGPRPNGLEGTVTHMAPELIQRGRADQRSDLYAAGVVFYRFLTGKLPIEGATPGETLKLHTTTVPAAPSVHAEGLTAEIDALVMRLLAKRPTDRPQSANEVLAGLGLPSEEEDTLAMPLVGPFVGRQALLSELSGMVGAAARRQAPRPVLLMGQPGLGKSRLLEELGAQARLMDLPVAAAQCPRDETPYGCFIDLGRDLLALGRASHPAEAEAVKQAIAPYTGSLDTTGDPAAALSHAVSRLIASLAAERPLVVLIDDWHRADAGSASLFKQLAAQGEASIWWCLAADGDVADFSGDRRELAALTSSEVASLMAANLGVAEAPESVLAGIEASAGGNPRMVEELLRYMLAHKQIVRRQSGWVLAQGASGELPQGLQELYAARAADFDASERALAEALALATCPLPLASAAVAASLTPDQTDRAASGLLGRGLALEKTDGLALADGQLGGWLAAQLPEEAAKARHGAILEAVAAIAGDRPPVRLVNALAHHGLAGPAPETALKWLELAARQNLELKALAQAKRFAEAAVTYGAAAPARERLEALELLATARRGLDEADAALAVAEEAVALAETLDDAALLARSLNGLGKIHQLASRYDEAKAAFGRAIEVAEPSGASPTEVARSHRALARLSFFGGDMAMSHRHGKQALSLVRRHGGPEALAEVLVEVGEMMQGEEERLYEGLTLMEEAQTLAQELDNEHLESSSAAGLGNLQLALGQLAAAKTSFKRAVALYEKLGNVGEALFARLNLGLIAVEQGFFPEAEAVAQQVGTDAKAANRKFPMAVAWAVEGASQAWQGRSVEGLKRLAEAAAVAEEIKHGYLRAIVRQLEAPVRLMLGQLAEARQEATSLAEFGTSAGVAELTERAGLVLAELAWQENELASAASALEPLLTATHIAVRAEAQILRARVALAQGDEKRAHQALHGARGLMTEADAPKLDVEFWLIEAELAALEGEDPASILDHAIKRLEETQQRHALVLALATLARLGPAKGRPAASRRALELLNALAAALGEDKARYMAAYDRGAIGEAQAPGESTGAVPGSIGEMRALVKRLEAGLDQIESQGFGGDGGQALRRLDQVVGFARAVNSTLELDVVTDRALSLIIEITGAERGLLLLRDEGNDWLSSTQFKAAPGYEDAAGAEQYSRTIANTVIESGEMVCVLDALSDQRFAQQASVMGLNLQTIICVPLKDQDRTIGAIYVDRQGLSDQFMESDLEVVQALSSLTAQAIINARLMRQQQERQVHLEMLNRLSRTISRTLELERVLDLITEMTLEMAKAERAFVFLYENEQLIFGAGRDADGPLPAHASREVSRSVCQKVVETQAGVYVIDAGKDEEFSTKRSITNLKLGSIVAVPLTGQAGMTGVLYIDSKVRIVNHLEKELMVLQSVGNTASLAIDNAKLYRQATVDGLTGLYVRSFFMHRLNEEIRRSKRFGNRFSLLVMDIDFFKKFNDTYGHQTGDAVLRLVAATIKSGIRIGLDLPCRYGGEEMLALLPETDAPGAVITAERIRKAIEEASFPGPDGEPLRVTISIGVASFPEMADTATELFERADQALYASKHAGRNQVTVYDASLSPSTSS